MNQLKKKTHFLGKFAPAMILVAVSTTLLSVALKAYAQPITTGAEPITTGADGAIIINFEGSDNRLRTIGGRGNPTNLTRNNIASFLFNVPNQRLIIPRQQGSQPTGATLDFRLKRNRQRAGFSATAGYSDVETRYYYNCGGEGTFTLGWVKLLQGSSFETRPCRRFQIRGSQGRELPPGSKGLDTSKQLLIAQNDEVPSVYICSAVENESAPVSGSGRNWGVAASTTPWDLFSQADPCRLAVQKCEANSGANCSVDYISERRLDEQNLAVDLQCSSTRENPFSEKYFREASLTGSQLVEVVTQLEEQAKSEGAKTCQLTVAGLGETIISPSTNETTVVNITNNPNGSLVVTVLAGEVKLTAPQCLVPPQQQQRRQQQQQQQQGSIFGTSRRQLQPQVITASSGQSYIIPGSSVTGNSITNTLIAVQKPQQQEQLISQEIPDTANCAVSTETLQTTYDSDSVQSFLRDTTLETSEFKDAVQEPTVNEFRLQ